MRFALSIMLSAAAVLSACADSSTRSVPAGRMYTDIGRDGASFTGRYSPSDFSQSQVRFMISSVVCGNSGLSNFAQETVEGQIRFSATCDEGSPYGPSAGVNFFLRSPGIVEYFATFESNGAIVQESAALKI